MGDVFHYSPAPYRSWLTGVEGRGHRRTARGATPNVVCSTDWSRRCVPATAGRSWCMARRVSAAHKLIEEAVPGGDRRVSQTPRRFRASHDD